MLENNREQEKPKVSVIMPVYNTAAYVRQAIDSIRQQTLQELEIIVVNDGSTDGSTAILRELAQKDERIRLCEQFNQGQSVARNVGVSCSTGTYIYFMDSDDLLDADALELCYAKCEAERLDFVFFDAENFCDDPDIPPFFDYRRTENLRDGVYTGQEMLNIQIGQFRFAASVWLNLIRREYLCKHSIGFYPGILHEDQLFIPLLYLEALRVSFIPRAFFHRRIRKDSIMTKRFARRNMDDYLTVAQELLRYSKNQQGAVRQTIHLFLRQMLNAAVWQAHVMPLTDRVATLWRLAREHSIRYLSLRTIGTLLLKKMFH